DAGPDTHRHVYALMPRRLLAPKVRHAGLAVLRRPPPSVAPPAARPGNERQLLRRVHESILADISELSSELISRRRPRPLWTSPRLKKQRSRRGRGSSTRTRRGAEHERPVCTAGTIARPPVQAEGEVGSC